MPRWCDGRRPARRRAGNRPARSPALRARSPRCPGSSGCERRLRSQQHRVVRAVAACTRAGRSAAAGPPGQHRQPGSPTRSVGGHHVRVGGDERAVADGEAGAPNRAKGLSVGLRSTGSTEARRRATTSGSAAAAGNGAAAARQQQPPARGHCTDFSSAAALGLGRKASPSLASGSAVAFDLRRPPSRTGRAGFRRRPGSAGCVRRPAHGSRWRAVGSRQPARRPACPSARHGRAAPPLACSASGRPPGLPCCTSSQATLFIASALRGCALEHGAVVTRSAPA